MVFFYFVYHYFPYIGTDAKQSIDLTIVCIVVIVVISLIALTFYIYSRRNRTKIEQLRRQCELLNREINIKTSSKINTSDNLQAHLDGNPLMINFDCDIKKQRRNLAYNFKRDIQRNSFELGEEIGRGNFGKVEKGLLRELYDKDSKTKVAIKSVNGIVNANALSELLDEIKIMSYIRPHPNLVSMIGSCVSDLLQTGQLWLVLEYCEHGELKTYLQDNKNKILSNEIDSRYQIKWAYDVAKGMQYLSEKKIMHGDLAARNVLLSEDASKDLVAKVADFGLSKNFYDNVIYQKESRLLVPWKWMAIEYLVDEYFMLSSDVWSYGVLWWEILSFAQEPYGFQEYDEVLEKLKCGYHLPCPSVWGSILSWSSELLYEKLANICFVMDPKKRASFSDVVQILENQLLSEEVEQYGKMFEHYQNINAKNYLRIGSEKDTIQIDESFL